jgi:hypothetical protein
VCFFFCDNTMSSLHHLFGTLVFAEIQNYPGRKRNLTYISVDPGGQVNGIMSADA